MLRRISLRGPPRRATGVAGLRLAWHYFDHLEGGAAPGVRVSSRFYHQDAVLTLHLSADGDVLVRDPDMWDDIFICPTVEAADAIATRLDVGLVSLQSVDCQACGGTEGGAVHVVDSGFTCSAAVCRDGAEDDGWVDETAVSFTQNLLIKNPDGGLYRITNDVFRRASGSGAGSRTAAPALTPQDPGYFPKTAESESSQRRRSPNKMPTKSTS